MRRLLIAAPLLMLWTAPPAAAAQRDFTVDCETTAGGISCAIPWETERFLFCVAIGRSGVPVAGSTVSTDAGRAVFNAVDARQVATIRCREE
ncbi:hypothetical protein JQC91_10625 [Jannaschia sp. Os4]|uniref:hypothetical protein n=1 Tax=Jannaschia sp. Os4 TaxID=2807617 RepID=UPI001939F459|nr:hypothetical protein [Jannaschia sp. Os4]MBM2576758.1 hypothetical protein [Jannaschia sp. Os4]